MSSDFDLSASSRVEIRMISPAVYDVIAVGRDVTCGGVLYLDWGFTPAAGEQYRVISWTRNRVGTFSEVLNSDSGIATAVHYMADHVQIEPAVL